MFVLLCNNIISIVSWEEFPAAAAAPLVTPISRKLKLNHASGRVPKPLATIKYRYVSIALQILTLKHVLRGR